MARPRAANAAVRPVFKAAGFVEIIGTVETLIGRFGQYHQFFDKQVTVTLTQYNTIQYLVISSPV